ncbi:hypothetical protein Aco03nite_104910 [Actinoplanes couchii]|uniref:Uncharacterized protein n=1 Tax=Actinoplanes couchii TaxID=403638 RepID=A0ABQ3XU90_9ACTN|nr:hypothetical protein Aco03nite_104910 [Actinoplanes couchii]
MYVVTFGVIASNYYNLASHCTRTSGNDPIGCLALSAQPSQEPLTWAVNALSFDTDGEEPEWILGWYGPTICGVDVSARRRTLRCHRAHRSFWRI